MSDQDFRIAASMPSHGVLVLEVAGELDMATTRGFTVFGEVPVA